MAAEPHVGQQAPGEVNRGRAGIEALAAADPAGVAYSVAYAALRAASAD